MKSLDQEPYPDVVVRSRLRRGSVRCYLSPATLRGEEWLLREVERAESGSFEISKHHAHAWAERMRASGLVVLVGDGA